jgi:glutathione S-transferase
MKRILTIAVMLITGFSMQVQAEDLKLWGTSASPYVRKVMNVLDYKQVSYSQEEILPVVLLKATNQEIPTDFQKASPLGKIPAISLGDSTITDSAVITAYLEHKYPDNSIYPKDDLLYADALWLEKYSDTVMSEAVHSIFVERVVKPVVLGEESDEILVAQIEETKLPQVLSYLNDWLTNRNTHALVSNDLSIADFAIVNQMIGLDASNVKWRGASYSALESYVARMMNETSIRKAIPVMLQPQG